MYIQYLPIVVYIVYTYYDGLKCPKNVEVDRNILRMNSVPSWFSLHGGISWNCIMDKKATNLKNTFNIKKEFGKIYCDSGRFTELTENRVWPIETSGL